MKKVRIQSVEDLEALPADEWVEVEGGMKFRWGKGPKRVQGRLLVVPLPPKVRKQLGAREGEVLNVRLSKHNLIVTRRGERTAPSRRKKPAS